MIFKIYLARLCKNFEDTFNLIRIVSGCMTLQRGLRYLGQQHMAYYYILKCNYFLNKTASLYIGIPSTAFYYLAERWPFRVQASKSSLMM